MSDPAPFGVLVMAYGTASGPDDIERYYTDIRGGRTPTPEHLQELKDRYAAIGNVFPLLDAARAQAEGLVGYLNRGEDTVFRAYLGMKHSPPFIPEAVARMREDGVKRAVGIVMAPHWSGMSVESYIERVQQAVADEGDSIDFTFVRSYHDDGGFIALLAERMTEVLNDLTAAERAGTALIFSAHSLPVRTLEDGTERTNDPWWGPPVEDEIRELSKDGHTGVIVCSAGFVADHLEVLYDLDIEAKQIAEEGGLRFDRTRMPNADPEFANVLASVVLDHLASEGIAT